MNCTHPSSLAASSITKADSATLLHPLDPPPHHRRRPLGAPWQTPGAPSCRCCSPLAIRAAPAAAHSGVAARAGTGEVAGPSPFSGGREARPCGLLWRGITRRCSTGSMNRWGQGERAAASPLPATCVNMWGSGGGGRLPFCLLVLSEGDKGGVPGCGGMGEQGMGGEGGGRASL